MNPQSTAVGSYQFILISEGQSRPGNSRFNREENGIITLFWHCSSAASGWVVNLIPGPGANAGLTLSIVSLTTVSKRGFGTCHI